MSEVEIKKVSFEEREAVFELVWELLCELGEEARDVKQLRWRDIQRAWMAHRNHVHAFVASKGEKPIGVLSMVEGFAVYANGAYGVINEMYVVPDERSQGVGRRLIHAATQWGREQGWKRFDVTTPQSKRWARTRHFYEREGFSFTGPKLKMLI